MDFDKVNEGHPDGAEPLHFYYNREERIARAPKIVQDYYAGRANQFQKGLFKVMFANRGNRFMFAGIVVFMAFVWIFSLVSNRGSERFACTSVSATAFSYADVVYADVRFKAVDEAVHSVFVPTDVTVRIDAVDSGGLVCNSYEESVFFAGDELFVRTKFPDYDIIRVEAYVSSENESKSLRSAVSHR